jgi:hypothetical protein
MALQVTETEIRSSESDHVAREVAKGWEVSWLPGRVLDRHEATSAMLLADIVGSGLSVGDERWPALDAFARELDLSGPEAVVRASTTDEVRAHIARAEEAAKADAVPMTGPMEESEAGEAWSRRVDAAVHGVDAEAPDVLDRWMQAHADSAEPHLHEAQLVAAWESAPDCGASWDGLLQSHELASHAADVATDDVAAGRG